MASILAGRSAVTNMDTDFGNSTSGLIAYILRNTEVEDQFSPSSWTTLPSNTTNGRQYGAFIGYNWQWDQLVVGFDLAYNRISTLSSSASDTIARQVVTTPDNVNNALTITTQSSLKMIDYGTMRARAGYAIGQFLPYATIGAAVGRFDYTSTATVHDIGTPPSGSPILPFDTTDTQGNAKNNAIVGGLYCRAWPGRRGDSECIPARRMGIRRLSPVNGIRAMTNTGRVGIGVRVLGARRRSFPRYSAKLAAPVDLAPAFDYARQWDTLPQRRAPIWKDRDMTGTKPGVRPVVPHFSSGPCAKRPGWSLTALTDAVLGRSHRSKIGKAKLKRAIDLTRDVLEIPADYRIGIVPASDTGAVEMALWSMLGARPVTMLVWESFGEGWLTDVEKQLKLKNVSVLKAPYGDLPDLSKVDFATDVVFTWNGTTSGVRVPNGGWIAAKREGLTICDATSAAFAQRLDWPKLDVVTFSWQKALGGEGAHGMLILSPRAVARLESYKPAWPLPKLFRMTKGGKLNEGIFAGETINTPSMLCVEDYLDTLGWAKSVGGLTATVARSDANAKALSDWVAVTPWVAHLANKPAERSNTSVCLKVVDPAVTRLSADDQAAFAKTLAGLLGKEGVAYDIAYYRDAPPGLRIWCGATVETADIEALTPWLDWAFAEAKAALPKAA